jgi:hypothetical protein
MPDSTDRQPPPEVAAAAAVVDNWLKGQSPIVPGAGAAPEAPRQDAFEKFKHADRSIDSSKMPAWKDPRAA